jgi:hypothetical protein
MSQERATAHLEKETVHIQATMENAHVADTSFPGFPMPVEISSVTTATQPTSDISTSSATTADALRTLS